MTTSTPPINNPIPKSELQQLSATFRGAMDGIRALTDNIAPLADAHDKGLIDQLIQGTVSSLGLSSKAPTAENPKNNDTQAAAPSNIRDALTNFLNQGLNYAKLEPQRLASYIKHLQACAKRHPAAHLLRSGALITLISHLDVLIAGLVRYYYKKYPAALADREKTISLAELRELGTIEAAENHIIEREVDSILRESLRDQLAYFSKRPKISLNCLDAYLDLIVETVQRRHLHVHNGGIVNRLYTSKVHPDLIAEYNIHEGLQLFVDDKYLRRAIDRIHLAGLLLTQQCWRKWAKSELPLADTDLNLHIFDTIVEERFVLAQNLGKYAMTVKYSANKDREYALLNLAQAYKWDDKPQEMNDVLSTHDWSSSSLLVQLSLSALRDDISQFFALLPRALAAEEIKPVSLHEWPIYKKMREQPKFPPMEEMQESPVSGTVPDAKAGPIDPGN